MKEVVIQILKKYFDFKMMEEAPDIWRSIENDNTTCVFVDYAHDFVDYQNVYFSDIYEELHDLSLIIYNGGTAVAIWPLSLYKSMGKYQIGSWGKELISPLLRETGYTTETKRKLFRKCINALLEICNKFNITKFRIKDFVMCEGVSIWSQMLFEYGAKCFGITNECFVDLTLSEQDILSRMRRTNKYSIQKSEQLWKSEIITNKNGKNKIDACFEQFRKLHIEIAGRETRNKQTWEIQSKAVLNTNDFVVLLYDEKQELIGASLFSTTNSMGNYSVAAYKRELFDQPVGHVSQWIAIKHMKSLGMKWYYIGTRSYSKDWNKPSEKEISIGLFKEGFATNIYPKLYLEYVS